MRGLMAIHVDQGLFCVRRKYKISTDVALVMTELFPASHENSFDCCYTMRYALCPMLIFRKE